RRDRRSSTSTTSRCGWPGGFPRSGRQGKQKVAVKAATLCLLPRFEYPGDRAVARPPVSDRDDSDQLSLALSRPQALSYSPGTVLKATLARFQPLMAMTM